MTHDYQFHINGLKGIKPFLQNLMLATNYESMGETDAKEIGETIDLAIEALEKQIHASDAEVVKHGHKVMRNRPINARYIYVGDDGFGNLIKRTDCSGTRIEIYPACMDNPVEYCSECRARLDDSFQNYCPKCGAKMDEDGEPVAVRKEDNGD